MSVDPVGLKAFAKAQRDAVDWLRRTAVNQISVVHHNDTDGIAAGAILKKALQRAELTVENLPIERVHPVFLSRIHTPQRRLVIYTDLGGQSAAMISAAAPAGCAVMILDHHPPERETFTNLIQVNPELYGIDGDRQSSAAAVAFFWARTLDARNDDLAHLAVLGAIGDRQVTDGRLAGLNRLAADIAVQHGTLQQGPSETDPFRFPLLGNRSGSEASRHIIDLAVAGYYRGGAQLALAFCLQAPDVAADRFAAEMRHLQARRFDAEIQRLGHRGVSATETIQWVDVADRFYPLGLKSIGIFCEHLGALPWVDGGKYIVGFQDFPRDVPLLGSFALNEVKVSMRVPDRLRRTIETGRRPDLVQILPRAAAAAGGHAEGCHRFAAACNLPAHRKNDLISALDAIAKERGPHR